MSYEAIDAAFGMSLSPAQKLTLLALAWRQNTVTGATFPTVDRIASDTGLSRRTVIRSLAELERAGHIARSKARNAAGRQIPNSYSLRIANPESGQKAECHHDTLPPQPSATVSPSRVPPCHQTECQSGTQTRNRNKEGEQGKKSNARAKASPSAPSCPADVPEQIWTDWLALRRAKRAPVTDTVIAAARDETNKAGLPFAEFLRIWCMRGSQGLQAAWIKPDEVRAELRSSGGRKCNAGAHHGFGRLDYGEGGRL